jgi:serralysin
MKMVKTCIDKYLPEDRAIKSEKFALLQNRSNLSRPQLVMETAKKWKPGQILRCYFMEGTRVQREKVEREAHKIEEFANIKLVFGNDPKSEIRIAFNRNDGSWSYVGTDTLFVPFEEPTMNFGWLYDNTSNTEYERVVIHEFMHSLSAGHEHQAPLANIPWNKEAVYRYYTGPPNYWTRNDVDFNLFEKYSKTLTQYSEFDPKSIMLYSIPKSLTDGVFEVGWNSSLSETDKRYLSLFYPFSEPEVPVVVEKAYEIKLGGAPLTDEAESDIPKRYEMKVGFSGSGSYTFSAFPSSLWMSVYTKDKVKVGYGKGNFTVKLSPGDYYFRARHSGKSEGLFTVSTTKVAQEAKQAKG